MISLLKGDGEMMIKKEGRKRGEAAAARLTANA
jgi:hypothetical protein